MTTPANPYDHDGDPFATPVSEVQAAMDTSGTWETRYEGESLAATTAPPPDEPAHAPDWRTPLLVEVVPPGTSPVYQPSPADVEQATAREPVEGAGGQVAPVPHPTSFGT